MTILVLAQLAGGVAAVATRLRGRLRAGAATLPASAVSGLDGDGEVEVEVEAGDSALAAGSIVRLARLEGRGKPYNAQYGVVLSEVSPSSNKYTVRVMLK